jgi:acyl-CoA hydrolase
LDHARSAIHAGRLHACFIGNLLTLKAGANMVGNTSMEIGVRVTAEDLLSGKMRLAEKKKENQVIKNFSRSQGRRKRFWFERTVMQLLSCL